MKKAARELKSTWAMLYKASHGMKNNKSQFAIQAERNLKCMFTSSFLFFFAFHLASHKSKPEHKTESFHHPVAASMELFGVYMIYEFKMKREWN